MNFLPHLLDLWQLQSPSRPRHPHTNTIRTRLRTRRSAVPCGLVACHECPKSLGSFRFVLHTIVLAFLCESILHTRLSLCVARIYNVKSPDALRHRSRMYSVAARMYSVAAPVKFATVLCSDTITSITSSHAENWKMRKR